MKRAMKNHLKSHDVSSFDFERKDYTEDEKKKILSYMNSFEPYAVAGWIWDCYKFEEIKQEDVGYTDGVFKWSTQDMYHIDKYNAAVSDAFLEHIMR